MDDRLVAPAAEIPVREQTQAPSGRSLVHSWGSAALAAAAFLAFLALTPSGVMGKTKMVGYAVCHQIASHSISIAGRQLPLCARCTGSFVGAIVGLLGQVVLLRRHRAGTFPPPRVLGPLALFIVVLGVDGLNSYLTFFPGLPHLYEPRNWLRLSTGMLYGLALSATIYPVLSFTLLRNPGAKAAVRSFRDLAVLLALGGTFVGVVLLQPAVMLYPVAMLSAAGVLGLLTCVNSVLLVVLARRENTFASWRDTLPVLLAGAAVSLVEVGLIGIVRFWITGTLDGIPLLG